MSLIFLNFVHLGICHVWFAHQFKKQLNPYAAVYFIDITRIFRVENIYAAVTFFSNTVMKRLSD